VGQQHLEKFKKDVIDRMIEPPWNTNIAKQLNLPVSPEFQISI